jgi:small subunit ribosomal protein S20
VAHSLSAKKRVRQDANRRVRNRARKSMVKTQIKGLEAAISAGDVDKAQEQFKSLTKKLDKISTTSTLHKNTAARMKSRFARRVNALQSKVSG